MKMCACAASRIPNGTDNITLLHGVTGFDICFEQMRVSAEQTRAMIDENIASTYG